jgi:hypothetical protein
MLKLYGVAPTRMNACAWYRTIIPFRTAARMNLGDVIMDQQEIKIPHEQERRMYATMYADVIQHYQNYSPGFRLAREEASHFGAYWETPDRWNTGPTFVYDTDDDMFKVEPLNPAFRDLGVEHGGRIIPKGYQLVIDVPGKGKQILWQDGMDGFDVEANMKKLANVRDNLKAADLVTTTTPRAAAYVVRETGHPNIHIYPNCIDLADWPKIELAQDDKVRITWQSSACHFDDMWPIAAELGKVQKRYPHVEVILFGATYQWLQDQLVPQRTTIIPWVDYDQYIWRASTLNTDITIAPLHDSEFNRCRSAIRMYEGAASWKPSATLAEATGAFVDEIIPNETGKLFNTPLEFHDQLCSMVENMSDTRRIAANAKDWVRTHRDPKVHVPKLIEAYQRLRDIRRSVTAPPAPLEEVKPNEPVPALDTDVRVSEDANCEESQQAELQ